MALAAAVVLGGCADHMNRWDSISFGAGNAQDANTAIHEVSPWPPHVEDTDV